MLYVIGPFLSDNQRYCYDPKFSDIHVCANNVDLDQTAPEGKPDQVIASLSTSFVHNTVWQSHLVHVLE